MYGNLGGFENSLFNQFNDMEQALERLLANTSAPRGIRSNARGAFPPVNIGTNSNQVDVYLFAAGLKRASLDISIQRNILTVKGECLSDKGKETDNYYRKERFSGAFQRVITLPDDVDPEKVNARYINGLLQITIERLESTQPRRIEIN